jgi:hypothetical protein
VAGPAMDRCGEHAVHRYADGQHRRHDSGDIHRTGHGRDGIHAAHHPGELCVDRQSHDPVLVQRADDGCCELQR